MKLLMMMRQEWGVGFEVITVLVMKSSIFWDIKPCNSWKINRRFGITCLHLQDRRIFSPTAFTVVSCSAYSSTLKMEAICSSETSVDFQRTTWRYIAEWGARRLWWHWWRRLMPLCFFVFQWNISCVVSAQSALSVLSISDTATDRRTSSSVWILQPYHKSKKKCRVCHISYVLYDTHLIWWY
jgi:hypothetical protein